MKTRFAKILSIALVLIMALSVLPHAALARVTDGNGTTVLSGWFDRWWDRFFPRPDPTPSYPAQTMSYDAASGVSVYVDAPAGALPANTSLDVAQISNLTDVQAAFDHASDERGTVRSALDISFLNRNKDEVEPKANVTVIITDDVIASLDSFTLVHFKGSAEDLANGFVEMEVVEDCFVSGNTVTFEASDFSVYAIIGGSDANFPAMDSNKYEFYYGTTPFMFNNNGQQVSWQYVGNNETLYYPGTPSYDSAVGGAVDPNARFMGWYTKSGNDWGECVLDPNADGDGIVITGVTGQNVVKLYARFDKTYYIVYHDENGSILRTINYDVPSAATKENGEWIVTYSPMGADATQKTFLGWSTDPTAPSNSAATIVGDTVTIPGADPGVLELYPCIANARWINFDKNDWTYIPSDNPAEADYYVDPATLEVTYVGKNNGGTHIRKGTGAAYVAPVPVQQGHLINADQPTLPVSSRPGYEFKGWYEGETQWTDANGNYVNGKGNAYLTADVTLTAKWEAIDVNYTIIVWKQQVTDNLNDEINGTEQYDVEFIVKDTAKTGSVVTVPAEYRNIANGEKVEVDGIIYDFTGFHHDVATPHDTLSATVAADGSTVLNVYYNRNRITINFHHFTNDSSDGSYTPSYTYTQVEEGQGEYYYYTSQAPADGYYLVGTGPAADLEPKDFTQLWYGGSSISGTTVYGYTTLEGNSPTLYYSNTSNIYDEDDDLATAQANAMMSPEGYWYEAYTTSSNVTAYFPLYYHYVNNSYFAVGTGPRADYVPAAGDTLYDNNTKYTQDQLANAPKYFVSGETTMDSVTYNTSNYSWVSGLLCYVSSTSGYYYIECYRYNATGTNNSGYYHVGEGPDPTAPGTHNRVEAQTTSYEGLYEQPFTNWALDDGYTWRAYDDGWYGLIFLGAFKLPNNADTQIDLFRGEAGTPYSSIELIRETLTEDDYSSTSPDYYMQFDSSAASFTITDKYPGFYALEYRIRRNSNSTYDSSTSWGSWTSVGTPASNGDYAKVTLKETYQGSYSTYYNYYDIQVRFKRKSYEISYIDSTNGNTLGSEETILFEHDLTGRGTAAATTTPYANMPEVQTYEGKFFTGWYADSACTTKVFFNEPTAAQLAAALKVATDNQKNADGTLKYTVYEKMPMKNLVFYAGYNPIRFRVWIQPNGGVISPTEATFFNTDWGEIIERYYDIETSRNYYPDENGTFYYVIFDHENPRRAFYIEDINNPYSYVNGDGDTITVSAEQLQSHVYKVDGQAVKYKEVTNAYTFYGWYEVVNKEMGHYDGTGNGLPPAIEETDEENGYLEPYTFGTPTTHDTAIRAMWRRAGYIQVIYNTTDKSDTVIDSTGYVYSDRSECIAPAAPTVNATNANYFFIGWQTPDGSIVQPNDTFTVLADLAVQNGSDQASGTPWFDFTVTAVYATNAKVTSLTYVINAPEGTTPTSSTLTNLGYPVKDDLNTELPGYTTATNKLENILLNSAILLSNGDGFEIPACHLLGWNDVEADADEGIVKFELGGIYGIGSEEVPNGNTLYAVWGAPVFYIYHSGTNVVERITDMQIGTTYNLAAKTADTFLYGGYYHNYSGKTSNFDAANLAEEYWVDNKYTDSTGTPYNGSVANVWNLDEAYSTASGDANGTEIIPVHGTTYYIKEVPAAKYLRPYLYYTYFDDATANYPIATAWLISDVDDLNYQQTGFVVVNTNKEAEKIVSSMTVKPVNGSTSIRLTPKRLFGASNNGFLSYLKVIDRNSSGGNINGFTPILSDGDSVLQYWVTPDGCIVTGTVMRQYQSLNSANMLSIAQQSDTNYSVNVFDAGN